MHFWEASVQRETAKRRFKSVRLHRTLLRTVGEIRQAEPLTDSCQFQKNCLQITSLSRVVGRAHARDIKITSSCKEGDLNLQLLDSFIAAKFVATLLTMPEEKRIVSYETSCLIVIETTSHIQYMISKAA